MLGKKLSSGSDFPISKIKGQGWFCFFFLTLQGEFLHFFESTPHLLPFRHD